jgi:hypothetical protein
MELGQTNRLFRFTAILGLSLNVMASSSAVPPQNETGSPQHQQQMNDTQSARPFEGKITKSANYKDRLVLQEASTGQFYALDNQEAAKRYAGKNVKIIATMDPNTNTLHIIDIRPADTTK